MTAEAARLILDAPEAEAEEEQEERRGPKWPTLPGEALHGLAGDVVRAIEPHTEADPAAVLFQFLAAFGSVVGRAAHFRVEADRHHTNLFCAVVGDSSKARKGTSWGHVRRLFGAVDEDWTRNRVASGLSSGAGLKYHVRDPRTERQPVKRNGKVEDYQEVEVDEGVTDKRLLVVESELASTLRVQQRDGNDLSAVIRCAWDDGHLRNLTKSDPTTATGAHISIIGHITGEELRRELTDSDASNGFANRFLWVAARRSRELPEGGRFHDEDVGPYLRRLSDAVAFARQVGEVRRDAAARDLWAAVYHDLSAAQPGLFGVVTARGEAQVVRLSLLYCLLDCSREVRAEHLTAALAAWKYAEDSAAYIFGTATGDPVADRIEAELTRRPRGMTREEIRDLFDRHESSARIGRALSLLEGAGRARSVKKPTGGRPSTWWFACRECAESDESAERGKNP